MLNGSIFFAETTEYLGYVIQTGRLEAAPHESDSLANIEHLTTASEL